jgi:hypothetical protein
LKAYFASEVEKYRKAIADGYPFTAANSAFQLSVDAEYARVGDRQVDVNGSFSDVGSCIASLRGPEKTAENFQWAAGADLREAWARKKLNETAEARDSQEAYSTLRDLLYANSWCAISGELSSQASDIGGSGINESLLSPLAARKLSEAKSSLDSAGEQDPDALWHYESAVLSNQSGKYAAAIYDSTYAKVMQDITSSGAADESAAVQELSRGGRSSLWGKIYYSHGIYLAAEENESGASQDDAYRILAYSAALDNATREMEAALSSGSTLGAGEQNGGAAQVAGACQQAGGCNPLPALALGAALGMGAAGAVWLLLGMKSKSKKASGRKRVGA